jgi:hypothetical protein
MAKRFTDTDKWKKRFFKSLTPAYKLLWEYICDDCDHAGVWQVDLDVASIRIGAEVVEKEALNQFGERVISLDNGERWLIVPFIEFQYGTLSEKNRVHQSTIAILRKYNLFEKFSHLIRVFDPDEKPEKKPKREKKPRQKSQVQIDEQLIRFGVRMWPEWVEARKRKGMEIYPEPSPMDTHYLGQLGKCLNFDKKETLIAIENYLDLDDKFIADQNYSLRWIVDRLNKIVGVKNGAKAASYHQVMNG